MAPPEPSDWELINAYADGELVEPDRTAIERRLATDAGLAAALAEIVALKDDLRYIRRVTAARPIGTDGQARRASQLIHRLRLPAAVAAVVAAIVLGIAQLSTLSTSADWYDYAADLHAELSANAYALAPPQPITAISTGRMGDLAAFDLSDSRLTLVDVRNVQVSGATMIAMHYRGFNGCSLTIAVTALATGKQFYPPRETNTLEAHWTAGSNHFYSVASGMDRSRFAAIAEFARAESLRQGGGEELRLALRAATDHARPCA